MGVIFADADEFKSINDRWGHAAGDEALRRFCTALIKGVGAHGVLVRMSSDEFLCIIPGAESPQQSRWMSRIHSECVASKNPSLPTLQASLGWAWADIGSDCSFLLQGADRAIYHQQQRRQHRDRDLFSELDSTPTP